MHKKLEAELVSLANSILEMENNEEIAILHKKAQEIYEKLTVLKFVENNLSVAVSENEEVVENKFEESIEEDISAEIELTSALEEEITDENQIETIFEETIESEEIVELIEENVEAIFSTQDDLVKNDTDEISSLHHSLEEEFENAISADVATNLFERATKEDPIQEQTLEKIEEKIEEKKVSLNDSLFKDNIQVGLNDRIAFVKFLFDGSQEDFNRVLSQLNSFDTEKDAKSFLNKFVKPDYNWVNKEEYEERLVSLIERRFL